MRVTGEGPKALEVIVRARTIIPFEDLVVPITTHPPRSGKRPEIPTEVLAAAQENIPAWTPELNDPGWERMPPGWFHSSF